MRAFLILILVTLKVGLSFGGDNPFFRSPLSFLHQTVNYSQSFAKYDWVNDDFDLIRAVRDKKRLYFVEASGVRISKIYPEDTSGNRHQKWLVRLSDGQTVYCAYNIDVAETIPLRVYDVIAVGGEFIYDPRQGPILHWLHEDPRKRRPDGYVDLNGIRYGKVRRYN
jgi:hypothetical protein